MMQVIHVLFKIFLLMLFNFHLLIPLNNFLKKTYKFAR